jgi:hypothetical protein
VVRPAEPFQAILELGRLARRRLDPAARFLFASATLAAVVAAGFVARRGTLEMRALAASIVIGTCLAYGLRWLVWRRDLGQRDRLVRRVVLGADREVGERVLRALALDEHAKNDPSIGSSELASLHLTRVVGRIPTEAVERASARTGQRYRMAGILLVFAGSVGLFAAPAFVAEGLDVLVARRGVAPIDMSWLESLQVVAQPPAYLRSMDRRIDPSAAYSEPQGSTIVVRGEPTRPGRKLVLTDGKQEIPFTEDALLGVVARYTLTADAEVRIAARFGNVLIHDPQPIRLRSAPDLPPAVVLEGAPRSVPLEGLNRLELRYGVSDDHGLRQIDLVLRSGGQEERRVLEKLDGQASSTQGAQAVDQRDPFLRRMFLPVTVTVEAKDTNALGSSPWGKSQAITITPPPVGEPEVARYRAAAGVRGSVVDLLAWLVEADPKAKDHDKEYRRRRAEAATALMSLSGGGTVRGQPLTLRVPQGVGAFLLGQVRRLEKPAPGVTERVAVEGVVLAVDAAVRALGTRDAESVAKRLGDVAEEVAEGFKEARETERRERGSARAATALGVLDTGAQNLAVLDELGADLGSVTVGELRRIRRAQASGSFLHAELAARHLAARLRRPTPSFGSAGGGVESGNQGSQTEPGESPSDADKDFDQLADELEGLVREHGALIEQVEHDLEEAERAAGTEELRREAAERAAALREAVERLPGSGAREGSGRAAAALAREHARAMADRLEQLDFGKAVESGKTSRGLLDEAKRKAESPTEASDLMDPELLGGAQRSLAEQLAWAEQAEQKKRQAAEEQARSRLREAADRERSIERRLGEVRKRGQQGEASLPEEVLELLEQAGSAMRDASNELEASKGERGLEKQREAQRLLEQSDTGNTSSDDEEGNRRDGHGTSGRGKMGGKADVPRADDRRRAEDFRKRVLDGLGRERGGRLAPAIERYAEGLLQ